ncbi:MAG: PDZ domain-containing protein [Candidatus Brocadiia bacterium]
MNKQIPTHPIEPDSDSVYLDYGPVLPEHYNQNRIVALIRDPELLFIYWEISAPNQNLKSLISDIRNRWLLRINNLSSQTSEDILLSEPADINKIQGNWYLKTQSDTEYQMEIGIMKNDVFNTLVKSTIVKTPRLCRSNKLFHTTYLTRLIAFVAISCGLISSCTSIPAVKQETPVPQAQTIYQDKGPWLGINGINAENGVRLVDVYYNSPAQTAGIAKDDIITNVDGKNIVDTASLLAQLNSKNPGDRIKIQIIRQEEQVTLISNTDTTLITTEELAKKYGEFMEKSKPSDKITFSASKKNTSKELEITLATPPRVIHTITPPKAEIKDGKNAGWMGIGLEPAKNMEKLGFPEKTGALRITSVSQYSPAEKFGLKANDIILKYDGNEFSGEESQYTSTMSNYIKSKGSGNELSVSIIRLTNDAYTLINNNPKAVDPEKIPEEIESLKVNDTLKTTITRNIRRMEIKVTLGTRMASSATTTSEPETNDKIHPELVSETTPIEILTNKIMTATNITDKYKDLLKRYAEDQKWDDGLRLRDMRYMHRDPFKIPRICDTLLDNLQKSITTTDLRTMISVVISELDENPHQFTLELKTGLSLQEHCEQLSELLKEAEAYRKRAFAGLTEDDISFIKNNIYGLTDRWILDSNLENPEYNERDKKLLQLFSYVDYQALFEAGGLLTCVLSPAYLDGLTNDIEREGKDKEETIFSKDTPFGKIIIGGKGNDRYQENAAIIIDIGGDDFYANQLGGSICESGKPDQPFGIIVDFGGNDRYSSYKYGCQGAGVMGVGILYDKTGDDIYIAQDWAQGSGLLGVGILVDNGGNDSFKGQEYVQGAGLFGIGILIKHEGNDSYQANKLAQGFAGPKAFGLLIDTAGNDNYLASTKHPNGYPDNPGTFDGWSQGCGTGMRAYTDPSMSRSGGVGVLLDQAGEDYYEAGTFSQGGGYFFGWGMLCDGGNSNDKYLGTRYSQGFAAHSAIGYFIDQGGDDQYKTLCGVVAGLSWDLTCVAFIDKGGNDTYDDGGFSRGASAHNGFCLFMDLGGKDTYKGGTAQVAGNNYHGGYSLSVFLDQGQDDDSYTDRTNNTIETEKEYSIFIDTGKALEDLIKDDSFKTMLNNKIKEEPK